MPQPRKPYHLPARQLVQHPDIPLEKIQRLNTYEIAGLPRTWWRHFDVFVVDLVDTHKQLARLTPRQRMVCRLSAEGLTQGQIAATLRCSLRTIATEADRIRLGMT